MDLKRALSAQSLLKIAFSLSLLLLVALSVISFRNGRAVGRSTEKLVHSYQVRLEMERLLSFLKDAETGQRGFIITKDSVFLQPYRGAHDRVMRTFGNLKSLTADNRGQQENLDSLQKLIDLRFSMIEQTIAASLLKGEGQYPLIISMAQGKKAMDSNRLQIDRMLDLEFERFGECEKNYRAVSQQSQALNLAFQFFALAVFVTAYFNINRNLRGLKKANRRLTIANESIRHAEEIGQFSTWQWDLRTNALHYSDNQYRLLGREPQSFEPTIERFTGFVHPDDRHIIEAGSAGVMEGGGGGAAFFRIVRSDGEVRHFRSMGKLLTDGLGQKTLIGVNMDITELHQNRLELEAKNRALEASNRELESFNHMASHDLQEPLRKIQTFVSRIAETEFDRLSPAGKEDFGRIGSAATRMRALIDDLLLFSETNKPEKTFEVADLNKLLADAKHELAQAIEAKNATILSVGLPEMRAIPFQLRQLFINLIANSIKYARPGTPPVIQIGCAPAIAEDHPGIPFEPGKKYVKLSFSDNGTGFEQQYAEKVFGLFYRLRNTSTAEAGTGLGLAICKKIAENHGGFIAAEGRPGDGATFTVFLPEG